MSSPKTPQSFIDKLNDVGFDVYVPEIYLTYPETLEAGWKAGVRCATTTLPTREHEVAQQHDTEGPDTEEIKKESPATTLESTSYKILASEKNDKTHNR